jgi:hypothetical protein
LTRRAVLRDGGALAVAVFVARDFSAAASIAVPVDPGTTVFLSGEELETLRALVDRFIPGKPEHADDGAVAAGCAEAIDALLGAFEVDPPLIYAGAPFSDRAGSPVNNFEDFLPLDDYETKAWRLRIQGSQGVAELEFNGPVAGFQQVYREGIAALDRAGFADMPAPARDLFLRTSDDPAVDRLVDLAFPHTLEFMYGAPEYQGNRDLIGWDYTNYAGDVQPRGWTAEQIEQPDPPGLSEAQPRPPLAIPLEQLLGLLPLASPEAAHGMVARSGGTLSGLRAELRPAREAIGSILDELSKGGAGVR